MSFRRCYKVFFLFLLCSKLCASFENQATAVSKLNKHTSSRFLDVYFRVLSGFVRVKYSLLTYLRIYVLMMQAIILFALPSGLGSYSDFYGVMDGHLSSNRSCFYV